MNLSSIELAKGNITIENEVIAKLAGIVAMDCYGVVGMAYRSKSDEFANLLKRDTLTKGIKISCTANKLSIDLHIIIEYGVNINVISDSIIKSVKYQVERITGLCVEKVNVYVEGFRV